jgi:hypothetical protein
MTNRESAMELDTAYTDCPNCGRETRHIFISLSILVPAYQSEYILMNSIILDQKNI